MALPNTDIYRINAALYEGVAGCCVSARDHESAGRYESAVEALSDYWRGVGTYPSTEGLNGEVKAELLLRAGVLTARVGSAKQIQNFQELAKNLLTESLLLSDEAGDGVKAAEACHGLSLCFYMDGAFTDAQVWIRNAKDRLPTITSELTFKVSLMGGIIHHCAGEHLQALSVFKGLGAYADQIADHALLGGFRHEYATTLARFGFAEANQPYLEQSLIEYSGAAYHYEQAGRQRDFASTENAIGFLLYRMGKHDDAIAHVDTAIQAFERLKDKAYLAQTLDTKARIYIALENYTGAEKVARRSVDLLRFGGQNSLLAESLITLGVALSRQGRFDEAERSFVEAGQVADHVGDDERAAGAALAQLEELKGQDFDSRRRCHEIVIECLKRPHDASLATRHNVCLSQTFQLLSGESGLEQMGDSTPSWEGFSLDERMFELERDFIIQAFKDSGGTLTGAANLLNLSPSNLNFKLKTRHKDLKHLQGDSRRRSVLKEVKSVTTPNEAEAQGVDVFIVSDHSLSQRGIAPGDRLVIKSGYELEDGRIAVLSAGGEDSIGICELKGGGVNLLSDDPEDETLSFEAGSFEVVGVAVGFVKAADANSPEPKIHPV